MDCAVPQQLVPWFKCQTSLTQRLFENTGYANVNLLSQKTIITDWWERHALGLTGLTFRREVVVVSDQIPCWYARTIIPHQTYHAHPDFFDRLKNETLGSLIYDNDTINRQILNPYSVDSQNLQYYWFDRVRMPNKNEQIWIRASRFDIHAHHFFLYEQFTPDFIHLLAYL